MFLDGVGGLLKTFNMKFNLTEEEKKRVGTRVQFSIGNDGQVATKIKGNGESIILMLMTAFIDNPRVFGLLSSAITLTEAYLKDKASETPLTD